MWDAYCYRDTLCSSVFVEPFLLTFLKPKLSKIASETFNHSIYQLYYRVQTLAHLTK